MSKNTIRILIEGPDLAGKSTVASGLVDHIRRNNGTVMHLNGTLSGKSWNRFLRRFDANRLADSNVLNSLYITSAVLDKLTIGSEGFKGVIICESYVDRAVAYGIAIRGNPWARLALRMPWLFPRFDLAVLLTCPYETRLARFSSRESPTRIDAITCASRDVHDRFVLAYRHVLARHENLLHFDTGIVSIEQVLHQIALAIDRLTVASSKGISL